MLGRASRWNGFDGLGLATGGGLGLGGGHRLGRGLDDGLGFGLGIHDPSKLCSGHEEGTEAFECDFTSMLGIDNGVICCIK